MARVTVEDCKTVIKNHFELVVLAGRRARDIASGSPILVERNNDKNAVIALKEIAARKLNIDLLRENLTSDFRANKLTDDNTDDNKREDYLELEENEESKFAQSFEDAFASVDDFDVATEFDSSEMSFEDENIDFEEDK